MKTAVQQHPVTASPQAALIEAIPTLTSSVLGHVDPNKLTVTTRMLTPTVEVEDTDDTGSVSENRSRTAVATAPVAQAGQAPAPE